MLSATSKDNSTCKIGVIDKYNLRPIFLHLGLLFACISYSIFGAILFLSIEKPVEIAKRRQAHLDFDELQQSFFQNISNGVETEKVVEVYTEQILKMFEDINYVHAYETHFNNNKVDKEIWTFSSALVFTTTTVIPVGYGYIYPTSTYGRAILIIYALLGIPLTLVTMADTGKFASQLILRWFNKSMTIPAVIFVFLLFAYPLAFGFFLHMTSHISFLDAVYFTLTSIFTIGFGDLTPEMNSINLICFVSIGVILVTITVDFVAIELIDRIHYMGRHVGKAKQLAGKMFHIAQSLNMRQGIATGVGQLHALAKFGLLKAEQTHLTDKPDVSIAFAPDIIEYFEYVDNLSIYSRRSRYSPVHSARSLFVS